MIHGFPGRPEHGFGTRRPRSHALRAGSYMVAHRDPFDRILAAQSDLESMPLITLDGAFNQFGIITLW
jgi:PIN domain nuclease of toxin-antitoxin system